MVLKLILKISVPVDSAVHRKTKIAQVIAFIIMIACTCSAPHYIIAVAVADISYHASSGILLTFVSLDKLTCLCILKSNTPVHNSSARIDTYSFIILKRSCQRVIKRLSCFLMRKHELKSLIFRCKISQVHSITMTKITAPKNLAVLIPCQSADKHLITAVAVNIGSLYIMVTVSYILSVIALVCIKCPVHAELSVFEAVCSRAHSLSAVFTHIITTAKNSRRVLSVKICYCSVITLRTVTCIVTK